MEKVLAEVPVPNASEGAAPEKNEKEATDTTAAAPKDSETASA